MKVIILAGGEGKRMKPIQEDKCFIKFLGKELILHQIEKLESVGLNDFIIVASPNNLEKLKAAVGNKAQYVIQKEPNGMADAVLSIENPPEEALIIHTNDIIDEDGYKKVLEGKGDCVVLGYKVKKYFPVGYYITEGDSVKGIVEKPTPGEEPSDLINIVVHLFRKFKDFVKYMKEAKTDKDDLYEVAMDRMMKDGYDYRVVIYDGPWTPIKYPWNILDAMNYFLSKAKGSISSTAKISDKAVIDETNGKIIIDDNAKILGNAVISGPCYIGKNSIIGNNCLIRDSMIGENSVIGFGSEVARSYISDKTFVHMSYVGDSIIMDNCNLGAGTVTANWRFDKKNISVNIKGEKTSTGLEKFGCIIASNSKTGINVSIMPGIKIGSNSIVGPHVILSKDLESNKTIYLKQEQEIKEK